MTSRISGWCTTPATGRFTASVRLLGYVDCLSRVPGDRYARFCGEGVIAISSPYPTSYRFVDPAVALGQCGLRLLGNLRHSLMPGSASGILEVRRRHLFPGELFYCYHCSALSFTKGVGPGRWEVPASQRPLCFNMTSALFCAPPCGLIALLPSSWLPSRELPLAR